jgi:hypothetical protein
MAFDSAFIMVSPEPGSPQYTPGLPDVRLRLNIDQIVGYQGNPRGGTEVLMRDGGRVTIMEPLIDIDWLMSTVCGSWPLNVYGPDGKPLPPATMSALRKSKDRAMMGGRQ